jgi:hypothetical protein
MSKYPYPRAKRQFLKWIERKADEEGVEMTVSQSFNYFYREPDVAGRVRGTTRASNNYNTTNTGDEIDGSKNLDTEFEEVICVVLRLRKDEFNPDKDDFYPLPLNVIKRYSEWQSSQSRYLLNISFSEDDVEIHKNNLDYILYGSSEKEETEMSDKTEKLQDIAEDIES